MTLVGQAKGPWKEGHESIGSQFKNDPLGVRCSLIGIIINIFLRKHSYTCIPLNNDKGYRIPNYWTAGTAVCF